MKTSTAVRLVDNMILCIPDNSDLDMLCLSTEIFISISHLIIDGKYKGFDVFNDEHIPKEHAMIKSKYHK